MTKLQKFVLMLSSENDGEVLNAARAIGKALTAEGLDWHWLATKLDAPKVMDETFVKYRQPSQAARQAEPEKKKSGKPHGLLIVLKELLKHLSEMGDKEQAFIVDMHARVLKFGAGAFVSKKQDVWIANLYEKFCEQ